MDSNEMGKRSKWSYLKFAFGCTGRSPGWHRFRWQIQTFRAFWFTWRWNNILAKCTLTQQHIFKWLIWTWVMCLTTAAASSATPSAWRGRWYAPRRCSDASHHWTVAGERRCGRCRGWRCRRRDISKCWTGTGISIWHCCIGCGWIDWANGSIDWRLPWATQSACSTCISIYGRIAARWPLVMIKVINGRLFKRSQMRRSARLIDGAWIAA